MKSLAIKTFTSSLVLERSITPVLEQLGEHKFTMELFEYDNSTYTIEWDIPDLEETVLIGIWVYPDTKKVSDYDSVFELPKEAILLLEENGFNCEEVKG